MQAKDRQTRNYYATYNTLLEIKELMLKETSLLNSICSQVLYQAKETYILLVYIILLCFLFKLMLLIWWKPCIQDVYKM